MIITISDYIYKKIEIFAQDRVSGSSNLYAQRGESRKTKIIEDVIVGTLGEFGVYKYLKSKGLNCSKPDITIHTTKDKSFNADLICEDKLLHVKSQSLKSAKLYGNSWLFQRRDSLYNSPEKKDILVLTCVDIGAKIVRVIGFVDAVDIKSNNLWGECKVPSFRHSKIALYLKDFEGYNIIKLTL